MAGYEYKDVWDSYYVNIFDGKIKYDNWLDGYLDIIEPSKKEIGRLLLLEKKLLAYR